MAWALALGLQGGLWAALWQASQSGGLGAAPAIPLPAVRTVVPVRWVAPPSTRVAGTVAAAQPRGGAVGRSARWVEGVRPAEAPQTVANGQPVTGAAGSGAGTADGAVLSPPGMPAEAAAALDLRVPRAALRAPTDHGAAWAAQDDRAHAAPLTRWDRLAQASGAAPCFVMRRDADGQLRKQVGRLVGHPRLHADATGDTRPVFQCEAG